MSADTSLARISMTIPPDVLKRADRIAKREGRSRSWVLAEAVRRLEDPAPVKSASPQSSLAQSSMRTSSLAESLLTQSSAEKLPRLDASRRAQLEADFALTPAERVLAAERTAREVPTRRFGSLFVSFDRFEDFLDWKRAEALGLR